MDLAASSDGFGAGDGAGDTICAVASPPGGARRAVIRVSGPRARAVAGLLRDAPANAFERRGAFDARLFDGRGEQPARAAWMPGPASYTGEDVVELHLPGAVPLVEAALRALLALGLRPARAGEFTRRAVVNGRLDLARAEGVLELVESRGDAERRAALELLAGGLSRRVEALRDPLEELCGLCEASLDFDESETGHVSNDEIAAGLGACLDDLDEAVRWERARPVRDRGVRIAFVGPPNAGKSSLFNRLADGEALVSPVAGTTRDVLRAAGELSGTPVEWLDLPGLDAVAVDALDAAARERARSTLAAADALVLVLPADGPGDPRRALPDAVLAELPPGVPRVVVWNATDRPGARPEPEPELLERAGEAGWVATSAVRGKGLADLRRAAAAALGASGGGSAVSREVAARHLRALVASRDRLLEAREAAAAGWPLDALASTLRAGLDALDAVTGRTGTEELLDRIFARFCLGK